MVELKMNEKLRSTFFPKIQPACQVSLPTEKGGAVEPVQKILLCSITLTYQKFLIQKHIKSFLCVVIMSNNHKQHSKVFKALCDEKRLQILELLRGGEKCACVLSFLTGIKQTALSYHMKILCDSKIVISSQRGKLTMYSLNASGFQRAMDILSELSTPQSEQTPNEFYLQQLGNTCLQSSEQP